MLHLENFFEKSFALLLTTPKLRKDKVLDLTNLWRFNKMALYVKLRNN